MALLRYDNIRELAHKVAVTIIAAVTAYHQESLFPAEQSCEGCAGLDLEVFANFITMHFVSRHLKRK
jgi:hypothetical protein